MFASVVPGVIFNTNNGSSDAITNIFANGLRSSANNLQLDGVAIVDIEQMKVIGNIPVGKSPHGLFVLKGDAIVTPAPIRAAQNEPEKK